jgi:hypothetical protein
MAEYKNDYVTLYLFTKPNNVDAVNYVYDIDEGVKCTAIKQLIRWGRVLT